MATAEAIARYFLHLAAAMEEPSPVTQMQLHKLLYYAQGWMLAARNRPLFPSAFQAWVHGPVESTLYPTFADHEDRPIPKSEAAKSPALTGEERGMVKATWLNYGKYAAWQLREMTHQEAPWKDARAGLTDTANSKAPITDESMRAYFRGLHEADCKRRGIDVEALDAGIADAREGRTIPWETLREELLSQMVSKPGTPGSPAATTPATPQRKRAG